MTDIDRQENRDILISDQQAELSMQVIQNAYAKITGKKEQISKAISVNHITTFEDLENLHHKIRQLCEQYNIAQNNESVILYHMDESREQFSSFDRFKGYNKSSLSPVENVHLEYNFLIKLPISGEPQNYKISIDVHSRASILRRAEKKDGMSALFFTMIAENTGNIKISYVDYAVSLNFMTAIDSWFNSLKKCSDRKFLTLLKNYSHHFSGIMQAAAVLGFLSASYARVSSKPAKLEDLLPQAIVIFGGAVLLGIFSAKIGSYMERKVDSIYPLSYVKLNRGDEFAADEIATGTKNAIVGASLSFVFAVVINVISNYVSIRLGVQ